MRQTLESAEQRHQAAAAERADRATVELREVTSKVEASAAGEKRAKDYEKSAAEEPRRVVRGATEAEHATSMTVTQELRAAAEADARLVSDAGEAMRFAEAERASPPLLQGARLTRRRMR